jgi:prepilin peptidase CpaA
MNAAAAVDTPGPNGRQTAVIPWSVAFAVGVVLTAAGLAGSISLPVVGCAAAFLVFAVASDVRSHRLPNLLTLPALLAALLLSSRLGATNSSFEAAAGAALGFALLIGAYAIGGVGAGDVKLVMALGAWIGPEDTLGAVAWASIAGGTFGLALLAFRGELADFGRRWRGTLVAGLTLRKLLYEPPARGTAAARGIPFAVVLTLGLAGQWLGGPPW